MGILQARILEWVAMPFSRGSSWPKDQTGVSCLVGRFCISWETWEVPWLVSLLIKANGNLKSNWKKKMAWLYLNLDWHTDHRGWMFSLVHSQSCTTKQLTAMCKKILTISLTGISSHSPLRSSLSLDWNCSPYNLNYQNASLWICVIYICIQVMTLFLLKYSWFTILY